MSDADLDHPEPFHFEERGKETVHAVIELDLLKAFPFVGLERACNILDLLMSQGVPDRIGDHRRDLPDPGVRSLGPEAAYHIVFRDFFEEQGDVSGAVLQVRIQGHDHLSSSGPEAGVHGRGLPGIFFKADDPDPRVFPPGLQDSLKAFVPASIIHHDDLVYFSEVIQGLFEFSDQDGDILFFVIDRDHHGEFGRFHFLESFPPVWRGLRPAPGQGRTEPRNAARSTAVQDKAGPFRRA